VVDLEEERIRSIVGRVVARLGEEEGRRARPESPVVSWCDDARPGEQARGFPTIDAAVGAAGKAQVHLSDLTLERRERVISAMRQAARDNAEYLAKLAWQETGLGRWEDKVKKNLLVANKTPGTEDLRPLVWTGDRGLALVERAPYGVIGAITPVTNPTSTIICNAIGMIAAGNGVVFNAHPNAKGVSLETIRILNEAIVSAGGPPNIITSVTEPTIETAQELMHHPGIRLLVVTGGPGVVKAAMNSGKKAICAGPGNPPAVVDETADIEQAARDIVIGASFDNNVVCVLEKEIIAVEAIVDPLKAALRQHGAFEITHWQLERLKRVILKEDRGPRREGVVNKDFVGKNAGIILREIGISVGDEIKIVLAETDQDDALFWTEQLMPVIPLVRVRNALEAIDLGVEAELGNGHTAVMHSKNIDNLSRMARLINTSIFVKNAPSLAGLGFGGEGYTSFSIASPTGEGLTSAKDFSRVRRCTLVDAFRIV